MGKMIWSDAVVNKTYPGRKGNYKIIKMLPGEKFLAEYISGEWESKTIEMDIRAHQLVQRNIGFEQRSQERAIERAQDTILETWYERFEALYMDIYKDGMTDKKLLELLEEKYPTAASVVQELCEL